MPPIFDYCCNECGHEVEYLVKDPDTVVTCWRCHEMRGVEVQMRKMIGATKTDFTEADRSPVKRGRS